MDKYTLHTISENEEDSIREARNPMQDLFMALLGVSRSYEQRDWLMVIIWAEDIIEGPFWGMLDKVQQNGVMRKHNIATRNRSS